MKNNNIQAFPRPIGWNGLSDDSLWETNAPQSGMTLRDYFAAKAMHQLISESSSISCNTRDEYNELLSKRAYEIADAMLSERDKV